MLSLLKSRKAWFFAEALLVAVWADDLAVACIDRLIGKGMEGEFKTYCENRIGELAARQLNPAETQRLELLQERLRRLVR